jgi:hypothetical protein
MDINHYCILMRCLFTAANPDPRIITCIEVRRNTRVFLVCLRFEDWSSFMWVLSLQVLHLPSDLWSNGNYLSPGYPQPQLLLLSLFPTESLISVCVLWHTPSIYIYYYYIIIMFVCVSVIWTPSIYVTIKAVKMILKSRLFKGQNHLFQIINFI